MNTRPKARQNLCRKSYKLFYYLCSKYFLTFKVKKRTLTLHAQDAINIVLLSNPSYDTFGSCLVYGANMFNEQ